MAKAKNQTREKLRVKRDKITELLLEKELTPEQLSALCASVKYPCTNHCKRCFYNNLYSC